MITVTECANQLISRANQHPVELCAAPTILFEAKNKILAESLHSDIDVPPADNSAMDGYAFCASDASQGTALPINQRIQAGHTPQPLQKGTAARIFTGAEIPEGADTVEMTR